VVIAVNIKTTECRVLAEGEKQREVEQIGSQLWETLYTEVVINRAWETVRGNIKISAKESLGNYELKKHKPWFEEGCSELLDQKKRAKLQWLRDLSQINGDNLNSVRCADSRHFSHKSREYLKDN
jgi:hypothetical protein